MFRFANRFILSSIPRSSANCRYSSRPRPWVCWYLQSGLAIVSRISSKDSIPCQEVKRCFYILPDTCKAWTILQWANRIFPVPIGCQCIPLKHVSSRDTEECLFIVSRDFSRQLLYFNNSCKLPPYGVSWHGLQKIITYRV